MTKLTLIHKANSIYDDVPDVVYDFPKTYLKAAKEAVGDWVIYYEPVKAGPRGYFAVAKLADIVPKPRVVDRFLARIEPRSYQEFVELVPRLVDGRPLEASLAGADGLARSGGAQQLAVRRLTDRDFERIVSLGLPADLEAREAARYAAHKPGIDDPPTPFERPVLERLTLRPYRDVAFRHRVRRAYDDRCAMSGLRLRNGGGRPEVQAAHIRSVKRMGSDATRNGLALSSTLHWMFDRGLLSVAEDWTILVSRNKVPSEVTDRLILPGGRLLLPADPQNWPHPDNLRWHRENVFGQVMTDEVAPWG